MQLSFVQTVLLFVVCGIVGMLLIGCCAETRPPASAYVRAQAVTEAPPKQPSGAGGALAPAPEPGQMKSMPPPARATWTVPGASGASAEQVVAEANRHASQAPGRDGFFNAIVQYAFEPGSLYQVYAAPMRITDIVLEPGEKVLGQPAAGDVVRWVLAMGKSMQGGGIEQWHVYLKPTRADLETNLAINTDRRTYFLELHSYPETYMAAVEWHYPGEEMAHLAAQVAESAAVEKNAATVVGLESLNFNYTVEVEKGTPAWTPLQVFDDGRRTFIRFPQAMLVREAPALFVLRDKETQLVNYRVKNDFYVVDRLVDSAELRVGQQDQEIVRILRTSGRQ
jgi:type IV secretion system protein VirB9